MAKTLAVDSINREELLKDVEFYTNQIVTNPIISLGLNTICTNLTSFNSLVDILRKHTQFSDENSIPLSYVLVEKKKVEIVVFENILIKIQNYNRKKLTATKGFLNKNNASEHPWIYNIIDENNNKKWYNTDGTAERGLKRILLSNKYTPSRFAARFIFTSKRSIKSKALKSDALGHTLSDFFSPVDLLFAENAEDISNVYEKGPTSCMKPKSGHSRKDKGMSYTDFYGYCPQTKVAYLKKNGKILARTVLISNNMKEWYYVRIYSSSNSINAKFRSLLKENNIIDIESNGKNVIKNFHIKHFTAKGVEGGTKTKKIYTIGVPYFDIDISPTLTGYYDGNTSLFHFGTGKIINKNEAYNIRELLSSRYLKSTTLQHSRCHYCKIVLKSDTKVYSVEGTPYLYCCPNHCIKDGNILVRTMADRKYVQKKCAPHLIKDLAYTDSYFDNTRTALLHSCYPIAFVSDLGKLVTPEDIIFADTYASHGKESMFCFLYYKLNMNGASYSITTKTKNWLIKNNMAVKTSQFVYSFIKHKKEFTVVHTKKLIRDTEGNIIEIELAGNI